MRKRNDKLLISLFKNYITFVIILASIFFLAYTYLGYKMSKSMEDRGAPVLDLLHGKYDDYSKLNEDVLIKLEGFIEVLDSKRNVIHRMGKVPKYELLKDSYSEFELLQAISMSDEDERYFVLVDTVEEDNDFKTILIRVPEDKVSLAINIFSVPYSLGKPLFKLYIKVISIALVFFIISIVAYSIWTAKKFKKPLSKIDNALGKVIEGDYEEKLVLDGEKEFIVISDTINYLIDKLKASREENKKIEESKTRMLIDLSHDIKTPITTIRGFSAALYENLIEEEEQRKRYYKTIYNKSEKVGELVDDLFEFVKLESVQYKLKLEVVDICEFLRQLIAEYFDEISEREFDLVVNIPEIVIELKIDKRLFKRVISNLIDNSLKYNPSGTRLKIELRDLGRSIVIEVSDNGVGIPDDIKDTLFDPFVRGDSSRKSDGGSGLGLSIAKKIVENHNGEISIVKRKNDDKTIFYIRMNKY